MARALIAHAIESVIDEATWLETATPFIMRYVDCPSLWNRQYWILHPGAGNIYLVYLDIEHTHGHDNACLVIREDTTTHTLFVLRAVMYSEYPGLSDRILYGRDVITLPNPNEIERAHDAIASLFPHLYRVDLTHCQPDVGVPGLWDIVNYFNQNPTPPELIASYSNRVLTSQRRNPILFYRLRLARTQVHPWAVAFDRVHRRYMDFIDRILFGDESATRIQKCWRSMRLRVSLRQITAVRVICLTNACPSRYVQSLIVGFL